MLALNAVAHRPATTHDDGNHRTGDVVLVDLLNALENQRATGKLRPAVLIRRDGGHWLVAGLTTNPRYSDGSPRVPVPDPAAIGLHREGWLWGPRPARIATLDVHTTIGRVDEVMAEAIIALSRLGADDAAALRAAARAV
ncbi:MAG: hypothetical protein ACR2NA_06175 [Solirubrobacterales bacterium]